MRGAARQRTDSLSAPTPLEHLSSTSACPGRQTEANATLLPVTLSQNTTLHSPARPCHNVAQRGLKGSIPDARPYLTVPTRTEQLLSPNHITSTTMPPVSGLPPPNDLPATWKYLEDGIEVMMSQHTEGMAYARYMNLYTVAYNYCTSSRMMTSGEGSLSSSARAGANLMGADLYELLKEYFKRHSAVVCEVSSLCSCPVDARHACIVLSIAFIPLSLRCLRQGAKELADEALLRYYASEWTRYTQGANFVHRLFTYLNRHWVRREKEEGKKNVYTVYSVSSPAAAQSLPQASIRSISLPNPSFRPWRAACSGSMARPHIPKDSSKGQTSRRSSQAGSKAAERGGHRHWSREEGGRQLR